MSIEFHCSYCDKYLKTTDDKAGRVADCPGCGEKITVPDVSDAQNYAAGEFSAEPVDDPQFGAVTTPTKPCPMCGAEIQAAAIKCRFCGEEFGTPAVHAGEIRPTVIDVGDVLNTAWQLYKGNFSRYFGVWMLTYFISLIASLPSITIDLMIWQGEMDHSMQAFSTILGLGAHVFTLWLTAGFIVFSLKVSRGQDATVSDAFSGSPYFLRSLGALLIVAVCYVLGAIACLIPGLYVLLVWWPFLYVIVDQDVGVMEALSIARRITVGNKLLVIALFLMTIVLNFIGFLALVVGILFVMPYCSLIWCTTYLRMSGQPVQT